jgi:integrase
VNPVAEDYSLCHDLSAGAIEQLDYAMRCFAKYLEKQPGPDDFNDRTVNKFILWMAAQKYAIETIRSRRRMILTLWRYLAEQGSVAPHKKIRPVAPSTELTRAWTKPQIKAILAECALIEGCFRDFPAINRSVYLTAFFRTAYEAGFRRSDVLRIRRVWIQSSGRIVLVQSKTGRPHLAKIRPATIALIDQIDMTGRDTVFGGVVCNRYLGQLLESIFTRAGIPEGSLKWFRRSGATHVEIKHPGAGWKYLGHTTPRVAEVSYLDKMQIGEEPLMPPELE